MLPSPLIPDTEGPATRPYWSVMNPTYDPRAKYLEETLKVSCSRIPGPEQMQIEVIDDCSLDNTASEITRRVDVGRLTFHAEPRNRGLANTWKRCGLPQLRARSHAHQESARAAPLP